MSQFGPGRPMPQPRRRNPLRLVLFAAVGVVALIAIGLVVTDLVAGPSEVAYANDDYQVPPADKNPPMVLVPQSQQESRAWLNDNAVYQQSMPVPVRCDSKPIDVGDASDELLASHFNGLMECLVRAWQPPLDQAHFQVIRPTVTIYGEEITTKCGNSGVNAFYCSGDQQIYYSNLLPDAFPGVKGKKWAADVIMAHEYGHLLQGRLGIFVAGHLESQNAPTKTEGLKYLRRLETQADCFSATFLRSVSRSLGIEQADVDGILESYVAVGDDILSGDPNAVGDHGRGASRKYWGNLGLSNSTILSCNTFRAKDSLVR